MRVALAGSVGTCKLFWLHARQSTPSLFASNDYTRRRVQKARSHGPRENTDRFQEQKRRDEMAELSSQKAPLFPSLDCLSRDSNGKFDSGGVLSGARHFALEDLDLPGWPDVASVLASLSIREKAQKDRQSGAGELRDIRKTDQWKYQNFLLAKLLAAQERASGQRIDDVVVLPELPLPGLSSSSTSSALR